MAQAAVAAAAVAIGAVAVADVSWVFSVAVVVKAAAAISDASFLNLLS